MLARIGHLALPCNPMQLTPDEISRLSPAERLSLIGQLWDSLADEDVPVTPAQRNELERRLATLDHDRANSVTWDSLKAELARR
jgi:putative addiction module component (TIGR02574 family)